MIKRILSKFAQKRKSAAAPFANDPIWKFWKTHPGDKHLKKDSFVSAITPLEKTRFKK